MADEQDHGLRNAAVRLLKAINKYAEQGTCSNLSCDPFHVHKPECCYEELHDAAFVLTNTLNQAGEGASNG